MEALIREEEEAMQEGHEAKQTIDAVLAEERFDGDQNEERRDQMCLPVETAKTESQPTSMDRFVNGMVDTLLGLFYEIAWIFSRG